MKRKYGYIGLSIIVLLFGIFVIKNFKHRKATDSLMDADNMTGLKSMPQKKDKDKELGYVVLNGEKKKAPTFEFVDQHGDTITEKDYKGKVYVVEFFFSTCPTICPIMNENLVEVQNEFKGNPKFGIASFSIDPKHDTPEVLKDYAEENGITSPNWHLMTGDQSAIYDLAQKDFMINAEEAPNAEGGFLHSGMFALIGKDGYMRSRKDQFGNQLLYYRGYIERGINAAAEDEKPQINILIEDIKKLLHE